MVFDTREGSGKDVRKLADPVSAVDNDDVLDISCDGGQCSMASDNPAYACSISLPKKVKVAEQDPPEEQAGPSRRKRVKAPTTPDEFFQEKRNMEDLWRAVFPVGTEWDQFDMVYRFNWNFSNLEDAFEENGVLHGNKVYLFSCIEPQLVPVNGENKVICIPVVVAIVSPFPPSDKIGINSVQREAEEILPMKKMKMDWVPYIPLAYRLNLEVVYCLLMLTTRAIVQGLRESGMFSSVIVSAQMTLAKKFLSSVESSNSGRTDESNVLSMRKFGRSEDSQATARKVLEIADASHVIAVPPLSPPGMDELQVEVS
ncbi:hypothetical protein IFM89_020107 [Coptis chinensis]|uniref:Uncharacterized protein n=1 Tax=Coptis chinensis TaxID=261450 RepID=A0A835HIS1_9MAGN|nr:hypothetical protein IFM89_020107 [Coptis chinensis]